METIALIYLICFAASLIASFAGADMGTQWRRNPTLAAFNIACTIAAVTLALVVLI